MEIGSSVSFKRTEDGGSGWVSRWSLEAPFPLRIGDGGSLWVGETVELGSSGSFKRIGDGGSGWVS